MNTEFAISGSLKKKTQSDDESFSFRTLFNLGVTPSNFFHKSVIHLGCDCLETAKFISALNLKRYTIIEEDVTKRRHLRSFFNDHLNQVDIIQDLSEIDGNIQSFDIMIYGKSCSPPDLLSHPKSSLLYQMNPGTILILSCFDPIGNLGQIISAYLESLQTNCSFIIEPFFSFIDALKLLSEQFCFFGSDPKFTTDWRWYKDLDADKLDLFNNNAKLCYQKNLHNFLDKNSLSSERTPESNLELLNSVENLLIALQTDRTSNLCNVHASLNDLQGLVESFSMKVKSSIQSLISIISASDRKEFDFEPFEGYGQQHISFIKAF